MEQARSSKITVIDYDPQWPARFEEICSLLQSATGDLALAIEHVGSTSVPGLAAKPIIDIDIVIDSVTQLPVAIERLESIGYRHRGNLGIEGREAFYTPDMLSAHHLYVCVQGALALENHLAVRDYLREHPAAVKAYGELKKNLAQQFPYDIDSYIEGKTAFILGMLEVCGFERSHLTAIESVNQKTMPTD